MSGLKLGAAAVVLDSVALLPSGALSVQAYVYEPVAPLGLADAATFWFTSAGLGVAMRMPATGSLRTFTIDVSGLAAIPLPAVTTSATVQAPGPLARRPGLAPD